MSKETIFSYLKQGGLSPVGACAVMSNMYCESLLKSNIVEKRCSMSDEEYTNAVDRGIMSCYQFAHDAYGYGLCQWTFYSRKDALWKKTVAIGISISDEMAQCTFCTSELKREYTDLFNYLAGDCDLYIATERVCREYERPAYNNIDGRFAAANRFYNELVGDDSAIPTPTPTPPSGSTESVDITVRVLRSGDKGNDVRLLQRALEDNGKKLVNYGCDGDFGSETEKALKEYQSSCNLNATGVCDADTWQVIFQ